MSHLPQDYEAALAVVRERIRCNDDVLPPFHRQKVTSLSFSLALFPSRPVLSTLLSSVGVCVIENAESCRSARTL